MTVLSPGQQLASVVCETRVVIVRGGDALSELTCGGAPMVPVEDAPDALGDVVPGHEGPTSVGKRYVDEADTVEVLCVKGGAGQLELAGSALAPKAAAALPSSD